MIYFLDKIFKCKLLKENVTMMIRIAGEVYYFGLACSYSLGIPVTNLFFFFQIFFKH